MQPSGIVNMRYIKLLGIFSCDSKECAGYELDINFFFSSLKGHQGSPAFILLSTELTASWPPPALHYRNEIDLVFCCEFVDHLFAP